MNGYLFWFSCLGFVMGVATFIEGFLSLRFKRMVENIPTSKIRSIAMGLVEIYGAVLPFKKNVIKSPFTNTNCVFCKYAVEEYAAAGGRYGTWVVVKKNRTKMPFYLKDNTGRVLIDPVGANIDIQKNFEFRTGFRKDPPASVMKYMKKHNLGLKTPLKFRKEMIFREYVIRPKDRLYIIGTAGENPYVKEASSVKGIENVMIKKGVNSKLYYISRKPEREQLIALKKNVSIRIFVGAALAIVCSTVIFINIMRLIGG